MSQAIWSFGEAREACRAASKAQQVAEEQIRHAARSLASAEESYRVALAKRIVEARDEGHPATLCADLARGDALVAKLRVARDVADGMYEAMKQASWRHNNDRKDAQRFADWSMRRELAEGAAVGAEEPMWTKP